MWKKILRHRQQSVIDCDVDPIIRFFFSGILGVARIAGEVFEESIGEGLFLPGGEDTVTLQLEGCEIEHHPIIDCAGCVFSSGVGVGRF